MKVYLDSDVVVASYDTKDVNHAKAVNVAKLIEDEDYSISIGVNILIESLTIVSQRLGIAKSIELLDYFLEDCNIVYPDKKVVAKANEFFRNRTSKNVGYSDCISFAIMKLNKIKKVFTFDTDFKKQGFEILR